MDECTCPRFKNMTSLAGMTQCVEHRPMHREVASSIPTQSTCLGFVFWAQSPMEGMQGELMDVSVFPLPSSLFKIKKKHIFKISEKHLQWQVLP